MAEYTSIDTVIANGIIISPEGRREGWIGINDGTIVAVGMNESQPDCETVIDVNGRYVLPGIVENHGHPGSKEHISRDFATETPGAAAGGITTWGCIVRATRMGQELDQDRFPGKPELEPDPTDAVSWHEVFDLGKRAGEENSVVDFFFDYAINTEKHAEEIPEYFRDHGVSGFKVFGNLKATAESLVSPWQAKIGFPVPFDEALFFKVFQQVAHIGQPAKVAIHNENKEICRVFKKDLQNSGRNDINAWMEHSPGLAEAEHIRRYGYFAERTDASLYVVHLTSKDGLEECRKLKQNPNVDLTVETCPHYLTKTIDDEPHGNQLLLKVSPPIRTLEHVEALWEGIRDGTIDCIGTDHVVTPKDEKLAVDDNGNPTDNVWEAGSGLIGAEYLLPLLLSEGVNEGRIDLERLVEITARNTARSAGLYPKKGSLLVGTDADIVVVDLDIEKTIDDEKHRSSVDWSCYDGMTLTGWPVLTMLRGEVIFEDDEVLVEPGYGEYVPRFTQ